MKWVGRALMVVGIVTAIAIVAGVANLVAEGNGTGFKSTECNRVLKEAVSSVPGVSSVEVHCIFAFGRSSFTQVVRLDAADDAQALVIVEQVYRALAADVRVDGAWATPSSFRYASDREVTGPGTALGFQSPHPDVWVVRKKWGITPK